MKRIYLFALAAMLLMTMQACSADAETETAVDERNAVPMGQARSTAIDHTQTYEYTTEELWSERDGLRIYGVVYRPQGMTSRDFYLHIMTGSDDILALQAT